jgi:hypothetical protein
LSWGCPIFPIDIRQVEVATDQEVSEVVNLGDFPQGGQKFGIVFFIAVRRSVDASHEKFFTLVKSNRYPTLLFKGFCARG